ncbi:hypothetical protein [Sphingobacterium faecium]
MIKKNSLEFKLYYLKQIIEHQYATGSLAQEYEITASLIKDLQDKLRIEYCAVNLLEERFHLQHNSRTT